ncbi:MAG: CocE/NonD family hydrolase [Candidatus Omnitrophota bacterium]
MKKIFAFSLGLFLFVFSFAAFAVDNSSPDYCRINKTWSESLPFSKPLEQMTQDERRKNLRLMGLFDQTEMVPMRDGVKLHTVIYRNPLLGKQPAIIIRTPYDMEAIETVATLMTLSGYAALIQHTRGRFGSEGEDLVFQTDGWGELQDGYDAVEWTAAQSWCDGNVGMWGHSAMGITASFASGAVPPHLKCEVIGFAASKGYGQTAYQGGVLRQSLLEGWLNGNGSGHMLPVFRAHPTDDDFWKLYDVEARASVINTPALFIGGFYDCFQQGTLNAFTNRQIQGAPGAKGTQRLIIGPWTHTNQLNAKQGQLTYSIDSIFSSEVNDTLAWFDHWLKGKNNGADANPPIKYYLMGDASDANAPGNEWRQADVWPPQSTPASFYLHESGSLSLTPPASEETALGFSCDPSSPVPTLGGANLEIPPGPYDQTPLESRPDVLVFTSSALSEPLEVVGEVRTQLYAEFNTADADLAVRLTDVYPDGHSMLVCDGILRASFRESFAAPQPLTPGEVYPLDIDLWSTSLVFNQGHKIRLIISNSNSPRFEINPIYAQTAPETPLTKIHFSPDRPSRLILPVTSGIPNVSVREWEKY